MYNIIIYNYTISPSIDVPIFCELPSLAVSSSNAFRSFNNTLWHFLEAVSVSAATTVVVSSDFDISALLDFCFLWDAEPLFFIVFAFLSPPPDTTARFFSLYKALLCFRATSFARTRPNSFKQYSNTIAASSALKSCLPLPLSLRQPYKVANLFCNSLLCMMPSQISHNSLLPQPKKLSDIARLE